VATTILLIRHAAHDSVDNILCGRMPDVRLGAVGRRHAHALAERLRRESVETVYTSPLERAQETAAVLGPAPVMNNAMTEIDFGAWTGRSFTSLGSDPEWQRWNSERSTARAPGGESMAEAQDRAVREIASLGRRHDDGRIAIVSHCDVIRAVLLNSLGMSLDAWWRFEISPASISVLIVWAGGGKVLSMNETVPT
jgi:broad specificity phosphatase PhoE